MEQLELRVSPKSKSADTFITLGAALESIPDSFQGVTDIYLSAGIYRESIVINRDYIRLHGDKSDETCIVCNHYARELFANGTARRTFNTATVFVLGDHFFAEHITFANDSGEGDIVGQAVALAIDADYCYLKKCRMIACQDTLFTGPLPETPIEGNDFGGPSDSYPRKGSRQFFEKCYIEGDIDFIFGSATALFLECELYSRNKQADINGYISAPSTFPGEDYGFIFDHCRLTGNAAEKSVYLGRPWRNHGKSWFLNCWMGKHIHPQGWHNWDKKEAEKTLSFLEYRSYGPGATALRPEWVDIVDRKPKIELDWLSVITGENKK